MSAPARPPEGGASQSPERAQPANHTHPLPREGGRGEGSSIPARPPEGGASQSPERAQPVNHTEGSSSPAQFREFGNRLRKNARHWGKWAKRQGITCYRLYDRDLPAFPLILDWYEGRVHLQEMATGWKQTEAEHEIWLQAVAAAVAVALEIGPDAVFTTLRQRQQHRRTGGQYQGGGEGEDFIVQEAGLRFYVNLEAHLDSGLFLDHRKTRAMLRARAQGRSMLNLFAYTGSFSVYAAAGGATSTLSVDLSNTYLEWARHNLALNGFQTPAHRQVRADVFTWLREAQGEGCRFDLAVLDPPSFSHSKKMAGILDVQRDHVWLIRQTLHLLNPGGLLFFSTNLRDFDLDQGIAAHKGCREITRETVPEDYARRRPHRAWLIETRG
ncbi:MAG: class I SAM-dependent methyltransferase [Betaproteobacteria bacterium]|nr:class I SAM-dependent methyltransferase [Betaproteobacteria bacterium]